jgi:hypothetical protein
MIPITTVSLFTTNRLCCWLIAGNVEALPNQASTTPNAPSAACKSHSITRLSAIVRPFWPYAPHRLRLPRTPAALSALTKSP